MIMKRILYLMLSLALIGTGACSKPSASESQNADDMIRSLTVTLPFDEDAYAWSGSERVGVYGTLAGENECYVPENGTMQCFGPSVRGDIFVYWPYTARPSDALAEGKAPLDGVQRYETDPALLLRNHSFAVASLGSTGVAELEFLAGILEISLPMEMDGLVSKVTLTSLGHPLCGDLYEEDGTVRIARGNNSLTIRSIGKACRKAAPLKVYAALPEGVYEDLQVTVWTDKGFVVSKPLSGSCTLHRARLSRGVVDEDKVLDFGNQDLTHEDGSYDE